MLQTDTNLDPMIQRWGCYFMSMIRMAEIISGRTATADEINRTYKTQQAALKMTPKCYLADPERVANFFLRAWGVKPHIVQIGVRLPDSPAQFWGWAEKAGRTDWQFTARKVRTSLGFHFQLASTDGTLLYDPDPSLKTLGLNSLILYQVVT